MHSRERMVLEGRRLGEGRRGSGSSITCMRGCAQAAAVLSRAGKLPRRQCTTAKEYGARARRARGTCSAAPAAPAAPARACISLPRSSCPLGAAPTWGRESKKSREDSECSWGPEPRNGMVGRRLAGQLRQVREAERRKRGPTAGCSCVTGGAGLALSAQRAGSHGQWARNGCGAGRGRAWKVNPKVRLTAAPVPWAAAGRRRGTGAAQPPGRSQQAVRRWLGLRCGPRTPRRGHHLGPTPRQRGGAPRRLQRTLYAPGQPAQPRSRCRRNLPSPSTRHWHPGHPPGSAACGWTSGCVCAIELACLGTAAKLELRC